ncbi:MAG TPA: hypothetical protein VGR62_11775 [Candidatus Binatia bacterium]|jgi:hypothetical protein|nr:hypothetical protein [Candidatus Binatia bacterium]
MTSRFVAASLLLLCAGRGLAATCANPQNPADLGIDLSQQADCDPIAPEHCMFPFPNDYFTRADGGSRTGRRINFTANGVPKNVGGTPLEVAELNRSDGFSPGAAILMWWPTVDLAQSGAPSITTTSSSLDADSPVVVIDARTGRRWPVWAETDMNSAAGNRAVVVRPVTNFLEGRRYIVAVRGLVDGGGAVLPASPAFASYRDGSCTTDATFESRRPQMEKVFRSLKSAGIARDDLQIAFEFTVASGRNIADRMLRIRDDAFRTLGGRAPAFTVTSVIENPSPQFRRRIQGTFEVPLYLTGNGSAGNRFALDANGVPQRQTLPFTATFTCNLPNSALTGPARMSLYGHGLLGDQGEVNGSLVRNMSATYNVAYCATDWIGMAEEDVGNAITILQDLSRFASLADRLQQGFLNFLVLGRLMRHPDGFASNAAFQVGGVPAIDTEQLYFDGNSQGAIVGGALCAVAQDFRRCVLGEAGMNYSTLLPRSVDFDLYKVFLDIGYPDTVVQLQALNIIQMLWDRGETNGYAQHVTAKPYPRTPRKEVLLLGAVGDHQVSEFSLQVEARTMGILRHEPLVGAGRQFGGEHDFGIGAIPYYPWPRSAYFLWDTGAELSPLENTPPRVGHDPHDDTPKIPAVQALKDDFWHPHGLIEDVCVGLPCTGPQF